MANPYSSMVGSAGREISTGADNIDKDAGVINGFRVGVGVIVGVIVGDGVCVDVVVGIRVVVTEGEIVSVSKSDGEGSEVIHPDIKRMGNRETNLHQFLSFIISS
ncbi:MAG: hypothetical protein GTO18_20170 [Anaerolineales bacterium]|nr:hypothetical protein [Anaerolineales bacterium]